MGPVRRPKQLFSSSQFWSLGQSRDLPGFKLHLGFSLDSLCEFFYEGRALYLNPNNMSCIGNVSMSSRISSLHLPCVSRPTYTTSAASTDNEPLSLPMVKVLLDSWDAHDWENSSDALTDWLNARWHKSGYQVSNEVVCFTLRSQGRDARIGLGDRLNGALYREAEMI